MTIPQGSAFSMTIVIMQKDSYLPQDLTNINLPECSFKLIKLDTLCQVTTGTTTITIEDALNGKISVLLSATLVNSLIYERGDAVDGYYPKPTYQGVLTVAFTDAPSRTAIVNNICVAPIGLTCG